MIDFDKLHHVGIPTHDFERLQTFYVDVLGMKQHPERTNWLLAGDGFRVHLMRSDDLPAKLRVEQHFALQVGSLRDVLFHLLEKKLSPWQASLDGETHRVVDRADPLTFGIGSLFVADPENNVIEFVEPGRGLFTMVEDETKAVPQD